MFKLNLLILLLLFPALFFAQRESVLYRTQTDKFKNYYNSGLYDSIFLSFSENMKNVVPKEKLFPFLSRLKSNFGNIIETGFERSISGQASMYHVNFEKAKKNLEIGFDNKAKITRLYIREIPGGEIPIPTRNSTPIGLPFEGEWTLSWGGDTKEMNYHNTNKAQRYAFDFVIKDDNRKSFTGNQYLNESYYAYGKPILSPVNGEIVLVVNGVKDNQIGETNLFNVGGNYMVIKSADYEYVVLLHFKYNSILVSEGQKITRGQQLGLCGNTGNSMEPHIHMHIQNTENIAHATGIKCYFDRIIINGEAKTNYSPVRYEKVKQNPL